jgi:hypothetical protein
VPFSCSAIENSFDDLNLDISFTMLSYFCGRLYFFTVRDGDIDNGAGGMEAKSMIAQHIFDTRERASVSLQHRQYWNYPIDRADELCLIQACIA